MRGARRVLFLAAILLLPVPYWAIEVECAPVARLLVLAAMTGAAALAEPGGVGSIVAGALAIQAVLWLLALALLARLVAHRLPARRRGAAVTVVVAGLLALSLFPVYRTPFAQGRVRANLWGIFG